jgi:predicted cupin superfamily sugar epimerase
LLSFLTAFAGAVHRRSIGLDRDLFPAGWRKNFSAFHRICSDEMWHFYAEGPLLIDVIDEDGHHSEIQLGSNPEAGEVLQAVVKAGCWFASREKSFALVGCTVTPGFDFQDFELGKRAELTQSYPQHRELIEQLTRG